jgi:hypothetical protein
MWIGRFGGEGKLEGLCVFCRKGVTSVVFFLGGRVENGRMMEMAWQIEVSILSRYIPATLIPRFVLLREIYITGLPSPPGQIKCSIVQVTVRSLVNVRITLYCIQILL